ncbi:unnamed protein product [Meloidogyne enterolobii]|uniref:Uncharacterized protein n=1 Tax=Meloidogyne enterolobii TaxID=390850 RepID=A0ACB0Z1G5_MELEN
MPSLNENNSNNNTRLDLLLNARLDENESFMEAFNYLNENLNVGSANITEQALRMAVEDRELALNQQYLEQFENVGLEIFFYFSLEY